MEMSCKMMWIVEVDGEPHDLCPTRQEAEDKVESCRAIYKNRVVTIKRQSLQKTFNNAAKELAKINPTDWYIKYPKGTSSTQKEKRGIDYD